MNNTRWSTPPIPSLDLLNRSTGLNKTLGTIGTPHTESIINPVKNTSNPRTWKTPKSSPFTHRFGRGITAKRTTKGSHKFPPSNPQEQGLENTPRESTREASENHHQEQPGTTHPNLEEPRRIIYTCHKGSYKV
jgi:hypothetical protein